jgi:hypothetical protein
MFPNSGLYLQVPSMGNIKGFSAKSMPVHAKGVAGGGRSNKRVGLGA